MLPSAPQLPHRPTGTAHSRRPLHASAGAQHASGSYLAEAPPLPCHLAAPAPRDWCAPSYLSHSCLHDLQAQLCFQLCLRLLCGWRGDSHKVSCSHITRVFPLHPRDPTETEARDILAAAHPTPAPQFSQGYWDAGWKHRLSSPWEGALCNLGGKRRAGPGGHLPDLPAWLATSASERFWGFCRMRKVSAGPTTLPGKGRCSVRLGRADTLPIPVPPALWHEVAVHGWGCDSSILWPCSPHLMLMKLAVERWRCLARSSSSCTPAVSPRGLWG